jgi:CheY-like chemotaxis protein
VEQETGPEEGCSQSAPMDAGSRRLGSPPLIPQKIILIVEDEPEVVEILAEVLRMDGHAIEAVGNGEEALRRLRQRSSDVIISDVRMPIMDGPSLYDAIEASNAGLLSRIVFLTGDLLTRRTQEFLARTRVRCLRKPFALGDVRTLVQHILQINEPR